MKNGMYPKDYEKKLDEVKAEIITVIPPAVLETFGEDVNEVVSDIAEFYMSMPYVTKDSPIRKDNLLFVIVFRFLATVQYRKEGTYGSSWCKRGEMDVFFNLARKFDRIENIQLNGAKDEVGESKIDTVGDLANYGLLWMTYFLRKHPNMFAAWKIFNLGE